MEARDLGHYVIIDDNCYETTYTVVEFNDGDWEVPSTPTEIQNLEVYLEGKKVTDCDLKDQIIDYIHEYQLYD